jgi:hypothetical protein
VARRWAQNLHLFLAGLIVLGILSEGLLIGPSLFAGTTWGRTVHGALGAVLLLLTLLLPLSGLLARLPRRLTILSAALFGLTLIQAMSAGLGTGVPVLAALHPANAMPMFGLSVFLIMQGWQMLRERI